MNLLRRTRLWQFGRFKGMESVAATSKLYAEPLTSRSLIRVQGPEVIPYLQGLITNDVNNLTSQGNTSMYTLFLNNTGRVLYDAIIYSTAAADTFLIECDCDASAEVRRILRLHRVRRKIDINCIKDDFCPWVVFNPDEENKSIALMNKAVASSKEILISRDPRLARLGMRIIQQRSQNANDLALLFAVPVVEQPTSTMYKALRYMLGVGEGVIDHPPGKCFPLESNGDILNGISFQKGCYVGQELTARVFHTGVVRKRLLPIKFNTKINCNVKDVQTMAGTTIGVLRDYAGCYGLALLRLEQALNAKKLMIDGDSCEVNKPYWWPTQFPNKFAVRNVSQS